MNKLLLSLAVLPVIGSAAVAGQPLNDVQMDRVTAGFSSQTLIDAQALGLTAQTYAAAFSEDAQYFVRVGSAAPTPVVVTIGETTLRVIKGVGTVQGLASASNAAIVSNLPGVTP